MKKVFLIDYDLCSHRSCGRPCEVKCPITITNEKKKYPQRKDEVPIRLKKSEDRMIIISEYCIECGVCLNVCPRKAIYSIYLMGEPENEFITHQYPSTVPDSSKLLSNNLGFRLYGLPTLLPGRVTGLCGPNGIGKSTVLNLLSGELTPNFGNLDQTKLKWSDLTAHVRETELRTHFKEIYDHSRNVAYKHQVLQILFPQYQQQSIATILFQINHLPLPAFQRISEALDIPSIETRTLEQCSGGELQRFAIASVLIQDAGCYLIDEPCTFLDVKKRIQLAELLSDRAHGFDLVLPCPILVVEHDLAILDYLSDVIHLFYGTPHEYGIITKVLTTKNGINSYLQGFLKTENIQFRKQQISFRRTAGERDWNKARIFLEYPSLQKHYDTFHLSVNAGILYEGEILGIVGENGTGKTTFVKILAGEVVSDPETPFTASGITISYKPQYITREFAGSVQEFIMGRSQNYDFSEAMLQQLYTPLGITELLQMPVADLSGGQLQRVFIAACLAKRADLYILDEPSAYLDVEERLYISSIIRSATKRSSATALCVEHDIAIIDALSDRLLLFSGTPGIHGETIGPLSKKEGMNEFLKRLDITFRRDEDTGRARINKKNSSLDRQQRRNNEYFYAS